MNGRCTLVTKAPPINSIDSKCHTKKLRTCSIGCSDFISHEWLLIAQGQTHKQTRIPTSRTKAISRNQAWWFKVLVCLGTEKLMTKKSLCDVIRRHNFIDTIFRDFLTCQWNTESKRKIIKDEKKHHGRVDQSSSEQHFRKSDAVTFVL